MSETDQGCLWHVTDRRTAVLLVFRRKLMSDYHITAVDLPRANSFPRQAEWKEE